MYIIYLHINMIEYVGLYVYLMHVYLYVYRSANLYVFVPYVLLVFIGILLALVLLDIRSIRYYFLCYISK